MPTWYNVEVVYLNNCIEITGIVFEWENANSFGFGE